jgi:hypothetical protein
MALVTGPWRGKAAALALAGALGVHHARYALVPPEHLHEYSAAHAYLPWVVPVAGALLFLAAAQLALLVRRAEGAAALPGVRALWLAATFTLLLAFGAQEVLEGLAAHGQAPGLGELLGEGGWVVLPLAALAGGLIALLLRGAEHVVRWALARRRADRRRAPVAVVRIRVASRRAPRTSELARFLAGRAPPLSG